MKAIAVDDEPLMLRALTKAVNASGDITSVTAFSNCDETLAWIEDHKADVAFLDINMRGMGGLELAERMKEKCPDCEIVFCTGYEQYAMDAVNMHASGYIMKPVSAEDVQKALDHIKAEEAKWTKRILGNPEEKKLLTVKCFGEFEVYANGEIVRFARSKSKEMLAYLIDRKGRGLSARKIVTGLWGDNTEVEKNMNYLRQISRDLRQTLERVGAKDVFESNNKQYSLKIDCIDCDYYNYLKNGKPEFRGEYMSQYSWAEEKCGMLWKNRKENQEKI